MSWQADIAQRYGSIATGLLLGTAARYGLALTEGRRLTIKSITADVLLLGVVGLFAVVAADKMALEGDTKAFAAAVLALLSDRVIKLLRAWGEQRVVAGLQPGGGDA